MFRGPLFYYRSLTHVSIAVVSLINLVHTLNVVLFLLEIVPFSLVIISSAAVLLLLMYSQVLVFVFVHRLFAINGVVVRVDDQLMDIMTRFGFTHSTQCTQSDVDV